jgi:hypothetical protein
MRLEYKETFYDDLDGIAFYISDSAIQVFKNSTLRPYTGNAYFRHEFIYLMQDRSYTR